MNTLDSIPDLLRRFVPTPYKYRGIVAEVDMRFETNDPDIVCELNKVASALTADNSDLALFVKIVRDDQAPRDAVQTTVLSSWPVIAILVGTGTVICLDCERREVLGFISPDTSATRFVTELLPLVFDFLRKQTPPHILVNSGTAP